MKLKILKQFRDKNTADIYNVGEVKEFEDARAEELLADPRKLVEKHVEKKTTKKTTKKK